MEETPDCRVGFHRLVQCSKKFGLETTDTEKVAGLKTGGYVGCCPLHIYIF